MFTQQNINDNIERLCKLPRTPYTSSDIIIRAAISEQAELLIDWDADITRILWWDCNQKQW